MIVSIYERKQASKKYRRTNMGGYEASMVMPRRKNESCRKILNIHRLGLGLSALLRGEEC